MQEPRISEGHPASLRYLHHRPSGSGESDLASQHARCTATCPLLQPGHDGARVIQNNRRVSKECPVLTVVVFVKAEPLSLENAISVLGASCAEVNQDIATVSPDAATEAAWVGQALIFQLSAYKFLGCDQCPFSKRRTEISRISSAVGPR